jgi:PTH1 family peptidyl-tRNA hydrolase
LGNPGPQYAQTRHNFGFMVLDELARALDSDGWKVKDGSAQLPLIARKVVLVKPLTFMNVSGEPAARVASWYKVDPADILVVSDDLDLPFGRMRLRGSGGSGGHNGLKSLIAHFGEGFPRLRLGIGRPTQPGDENADAIDHVLAPFTPSERTTLGAVTEAGAQAVVRWLNGGIEPAMQFANAWQPAM